MELQHLTPEPDAATDPVCGMTIDPASASASRTYEGAAYRFCSTSCAEEFDASPMEYAKP